MFLIAGISPRTIVVDKNPRICPGCGLNQAYFKRIDHYFNLFFIPILRVKKGDPFIMCDRCEKTGHEFDQEYAAMPARPEMTCNHCGINIDQNFKYCPHCGKPMTHE